MKRLVKAVIPAAGFGSRLQPLTLAVPKELLPVNRKPMIHWAVEEALAAGIREICIVIRKGKKSISSYFKTLIGSSNPVWEGFIRELSLANLQFVFQKEPLGLGNAIYEAGSFIKDSPFCMIIPDQFLLSKVPATKQLLDASIKDFQGVWSSLATISRDELRFFPGARTFELTQWTENIWKVTGIRENSGHKGNETLLGFGRTLFPAGTLEVFSNRFLNPETGEVDLLPSFEFLIKQYQNYALILDGQAMDFGTWEGYEHFSQIL